MALYQCVIPNGKVLSRNRVYFVNGKQPAAVEASAQQFYKS